MICEAKGNTVVNDHPVILGLWPIAGVTTIGVTERDAIATIHAALDVGIHCFDTAYSYGYEGESDRRLGQVLRERNESVKVIGKVGQRWNGTQRVVDGTRATLIADAEQSLSRLGRPHFDCLMLHSPDPNVPIETSAETIAELQRRELCQSVGVCNVTLDQLQRFSSVVRCDAIQCPLNLLQRDPLNELIAPAGEQGIQVMTFWALMKGLLAGTIGPDHQLDPSDPRLRYEIFRGEPKRRADQVVAGLKELAKTVGQSVAQLAIGWVLAQSGVTSVLAGARRPDQVRDWASSTSLTSEVVSQIDRLVESVFESENH